MADKRIIYENFDELLEEPFDRLEKMVDASPIERCDRMLERLDTLETELTRFLESAVVEEGREKQ
ncbi:MAG: hypothetical protein ACLFM0_11110 [Spirochaetales bacterium]